MKYFTSILLISFVIIGCRTQRATSNDGNSLPVSSALSDSSIIISFEQTACYGTCPVHRITVLKNGYATYHGDRHVAQIGDYYASFTPEQIALIYAKAHELKFFDLKSNYTANMTDLPTTLVSINTPTQQKSVSAYGEYPKNLQEFITFLGEDLQKIVWTKRK